MYILLVVLLLLGDFIIKAFSSKNNIRKIESYFSGFLVFLFSALHGENVGTDMPAYYKIFYQDSYMSLIDITNASPLFYEQGRDKLFHYIMHLLSFIYDDPQIMLLFTGAVVSVGVSIYFYRYSKDIIFSFLLFICLRTFSFTVAGLRQAIAMSILLFSIDLIKKKKLPAFVCLVLLASGFHASAVVFLLAYPISLYKNHIRLAIYSVGFIMTCFITNFYPFKLILYIPYIGTRFAGYLSFEFSTSGLNTVFLLILMYCVCLIYVYNLKRTNEALLSQHGMEFNLTTIAILFSCSAFVFADIYRISSYFLFALYALFPSAMDVIKPAKSVKLIFILLLISQYIILGSGANTEVYSFFWE